MEKQALAVREQQWYQTITTAKQSGQSIKSWCAENSSLSSCMPHKNGKNFSDRFSIILKVDFRSRAFLNL